MSVNNSNCSGGGGTRRGAVTTSGRRSDCSHDSYVEELVRPNAGVFWMCFAVAFYVVIGGS